MSTTREPLSRDRVVEAALAVIDRAGIQGCSMRAVAGELGVEAMSLYHHVPGGKDEMLDGGFFPGTVRDPTAHGAPDRCSVSARDGIGLRMRDALHVAGLLH